MDMQAGHRAGGAGIETAPGRARGHAHPGRGVSPLIQELPGRAAHDYFISLERSPPFRISDHPIPQLIRVRGLYHGDY